MGRSPSSEKNEIKKGPWTPEEDQKLIDYIQKNGYGNWRTLPINAGLQRCGKSCRLRWTNYLRPDIKRGSFSLEEEETIIHLHSLLGNKWSMIAAHLPGRTDNEIKNYWNTHVRKRLMRMGIDPVTHNPCLDLLDLSSLANTSSTHMNLSRLLGLQNPYINIPELLRLFSSQNINQDFSLENQENHHLLLNNLNPLIRSTQIIHNPIEDSIPYCSGPQPIMQPNNSESATGSEFSDVTLMPSNFPQGSVSYDQSYVTYDDVNNIQSNDINNFNFQSGPSNLSTPSSTPTGITSSSNYINGSSTEDERESYCSNLKFDFPENMDDFKFMFPNCIDNTY